MGEIRALLGSHLPGYEVRSIVKRGEGLDNTAYEVNGDLIVRASKETDPALRSESTQREAQLLAMVAKLSTLPVPEPVFVDAEAGLLAYFKLSGDPLMDHPVAEPARLAPALGGFLSRLHQAPLKRVEHLVEWDAYTLLAWREDAQRAYQEISGQLSTAHRSLVENFLGRTPPPEPRAAGFCHNDLGAEHMLVDLETNTVTGVIDWTDAAIADPARDLALIYRDLSPEIFELTLVHYEGYFDDADRERAVFYARCKLLEDLAYGVRTGVPDMKGDSQYFGELTRNSFDVYVYDMVGRGRSHRLTDPQGYTLRRDVADLEAIREKIGAERVALIGHSYGGALAAAYAASYPEHVAKVVLSSPEDPSPGLEGASMRMLKTKGNSEDAAERQTGREAQCPSRPSIRSRK